MAEELPQDHSHVLLVEDSATQALLLQSVLEAGGCSVTVVTSAEDALTYIQKDLPDLVVVDLYLPGMRGDEFCRQLRMNFETRELPVLMLTAEKSQSAELSSLDSGADAFVPKSIDPEVLISRVQSLVAKSTVQSSKDNSVHLSQASYQRARVLTIDDSMTYLEFLREQLSAEGYELDQACDGREGIAKLEAENYDCVVVDLVMPGMDGIAVCEQIDRIRKERQAPIVALMLTSNENKEDLTRALASGADDFVGKSSDTAVLKGRIRALLRRKFFQEENSRILEELKNKELETVKARAEKEVAEARASLVEELEIARDAAEQASLTKSDFLANMSHEIRTPMNGVIGMTEMLLKTTLSDQQKNYANLVKHSAESLLGLLNDILDFSKIEAGKMDIEQHGFQIREMLGETLHMLAMKASEKDIELSCRIPPELPDTFIGDSVRLRQVLVNLVGNAVKFTEQGQIEVLVDIKSCKVESMLVEFAVKDSGCGIAEDKIDKIFASFSQADTSTTRKFGGTGLGLSISRQLVGLMGGSIEVESEIGTGSTFRFTAELGITGESAEVPSLLEATVLVVDDQKASRESVAEVLEGWNLDVIKYQSGLEVLSDIQDGQNYDLAIISLVMDEMDGVTLAENLSMFVDPAPPFIMVHPANRPLSEGEGERIMPASCLLKPVNFCELGQSLKTALGEQDDNNSSQTDQDEKVRPLNVLLAEDGRVNQIVAREMLEDMGHSVSIVENGQLAVDYVEENGCSIDVVLMDVQMPELNGIEATQTIRQSDKYAEIPIVAMTANAMKGDREQCLKAGMNDYVAKPIRPNELAGALSKIASEISEVDEVPVETTHEFDEEAFLERFGNKPDLVKSLAEFFEEDSTEFLEQISNFIESKDQAIVDPVHSLKGLVGNYTAPGAHRLISKYYSYARNEDWNGLSDHFSLLESMIVDLGASLRSISDNELELAG